MRLQIEWHPCNEDNMPDDGRLVLFMRTDRESGEVLRWDKYASWAKWTEHEWRWGYVDELSS